MAKINLAQLKKILHPKWTTGGKVGGPAKPDPKKPGVIDVGSFIAHRQPAEILNVVRSPRKRVVIISPFMAEDKALGDKMNRYALRAVRDSLAKNESPIASHSFYWGLNITNAIERDVGLTSQLSWIPDCDIVAVYSDFGITQAMKVAINTAMIRNKKIEYRVISAHA